MRRAEFCRRRRRSLVVRARAFRSRVLNLAETGSMGLSSGVFSAGRPGKLRHPGSHSVPRLPCGSRDCPRPTLALDLGQFRRPFHPGVQISQLLLAARFRLRENGRIGGLLWAFAPYMPMSQSGANRLQGDESSKKPPRVRSSPLIADRPSGMRSDRKFKLRVIVSSTRSMDVTHASH